MTESGSFQRRASEIQRRLDAGFTPRGEDVEWLLSIARAAPPQEGPVVSDDHTVRVLPWDGTAGKRKCDWIDCDKPPIIHAELSAPNSEYGADSDLCEEHLPKLGEQVRAFAVALGLVVASTESERNIVATVREHLP